MAPLCIKWLKIVLCMLLFTGSAFAQEASNTDVKQLWQLLDYVAVDYSGAIANGNVVSELEYTEMTDFTANAVTLAEGLASHGDKIQIQDTIGQLREAVLQKADAVRVAELAQRANALLLGAYPMPVAPASIPDLAVGASLYANLCASCHGAEGDGDGQLASSLDPEPIAFADADRAASRSVMALHQVTTQGVEGTSMPSFAALTEDERWALAFYVSTLSYDEAMRGRGETLWKNDPQVRAYFTDVSVLTTVTEDALSGQMPGDKARDILAYLRSHPQIVEADKATGLALSRQRVQESLQALQTGDAAAATRLALSAYLDGFEPLEPKIAAYDRDLVVGVENAMAQYRAAVAKNDIEQAHAAAVGLDSLFAQIDSEVGQTAASAGTTFLGALVILLREGLEALLIVIGIIAFLKKADRSDALRFVHAGWVVALLAGGLTWAIATYFVSISGASREVTEGLGSVFAALVLLSVGLWMHQKSSAGQWQAYLHRKVTAAMSRRAAWGLFALAFIAVYREVFETVLFYSALAADGNSSALLGGFLLATALLAVIAWLLLRTSARMPIGKFFSITSFVVAVLAVVLVGKGVSNLQEAGWVGVLPVDGPRFELLGVYPTVETLTAQIVVLLLVVVGFAINSAKGRRLKTDEIP